MACMFENFIFKEKFECTTAVLHGTGTKNSPYVLFSKILFYFKKIFFGCQMWP